MQKRVLMLATSAFILACGGTAATAQQGPMKQQPQIPQQQERELHHPFRSRRHGPLGKPPYRSECAIVRWILRPPFRSYGRAAVSHCGPCSGIGGARHSLRRGRQVVRCSGGALVGGGQHPFRRKRCRGVKRRAP